MEIAYTVHTETATFLLDAGGFCRKVIPVPGVKGERALAQAERCIGAQYVASLAVQVAGGLIELPRVGVPLLFAIADAAGRISLIRTAVLLRFEAKRKSTSGVHELRTPIEPIQIPAAARPDDDVSEEIATVRRPPASLKNVSRQLARTPAHPVAAVPPPPKRQVTIPPPPRASSVPPPPPRAGTMPPPPARPIAAPVRLMAPARRPPPLPTAARTSRITPDSSSEILIPWRDTAPDSSPMEDDDYESREARRADLADLTNRGNGAGIERIPAPTHHRRRRYG